MPHHAEEPTMLTARHFAAFALVSTLAACAPGAAELPTDDEASESDARALAAGTHYLVTRQDYRKCISPMCGGVYVKAANRQKTTCFDGTKQEECYVGALELSALELGGESEQALRDRAIAGEVLFTGSLELLQGDIAQLVASEARASLSDDDAVGTYYFVEATGVKCAKAPCPVFRARNLNATSVKDLTGLDTSALGLDEAGWSELSDELYSKGLVIAGVIKTKGQSKTLHASQAFPLVESERLLCLGDEACGEGAYCDHSECLSNCPPGMMCPAVCYGVCTEGKAPPPAGASCQGACDGASSDQSCWCDDSCSYYGDCCSDYTDVCL